MTELELHIDVMGRRGEGIAHHQDRTVFVPRALPGEDLRAAGDGDRLRIVAIGTPSPDRVAPFCKHYERCGGCQLQHWREEP